MNKKEIQAKVHELLVAGTDKTKVFEQLTGQGVKDSQLAYFIASYADPVRCDNHERKVNILITVMFILALIAFLLGFGIGAKIGPNAKWIVGTLIAFIPLLFAWGFYTHRVGAYNGYILLTIIQFPRSFEGFTSSPVPTSIAIAVNLALLAYVWYVREKLFPDFAFITPKKIKGEYVFSV
jgi:hypothetical protein